METQHGVSQPGPRAPKLFPRMSVTENLEMGVFQRTDKANFKDDMDRVFTLFPRLAERRTQKAGTLSGGEQQMCAIGRALMARPKLLMLDEPSLGLAPIFVERIFETVIEINRQGTAILLVEQNALMALDVASCGYVLETGNVALEGPAADLKTNEQVRKTYLGRGVSEGHRFPTTSAGSWPALAVELDQTCFGYCDAGVGRRP